MMREGENGQAASSKQKANVAMQCEAMQCQSSESARERQISCEGQRLKHVSACAETPL